MFAKVARRQPTRVTTRANRVRNHTNRSRVSRSTMNVRRSNIAYRAFNEGAGAGAGSGKSEHNAFNAEAFVSGMNAKLAMGVGAGVALTTLLWGLVTGAEAEEVDYDAVREDIAALLDDYDYDDGSYGPVLVRLAWHASGTYDKVSGTGGSDGATMRFSPESGHGANAGLQVARDLLESVKEKYPGISYADLWTLAGAVAIEEMGGPSIPWRPGRSDKPDGSYCPPDGRLPDAAKTQDHVRNVFYRMGFNDQEIVALLGAHGLGRCHTDRSGYDGPWTHSPTTFSNAFFVDLLETSWRVKNWDGPFQFGDKEDDVMMLPADMSLIVDDEFKKWVKVYAADEERFFKDFAAAFSKLMELGCKNLQ